ncbi:MAG: LysM peptidoglycan-binding domain-containing protein [Patescibacteria group bacterium]
MNLIKRISYGMASLAAAAVVSIAPVAQAQVSSDVFGNISGSNLGLGQLFVLDRLFAGSNGILNSRTNGFVYVVQSGDTLRSIAARYLGNANLYGQIVAANNISNPNIINPGQQLVIPTANTTVYSNGVNTGGVLNTGNNLGNLFVLGRLFGGNQPMNLGDYLIMDQLFNNGAYGSIGGSGVVNTGGGTSLGDMFILDQLFGGSSVPSTVVPVAPSVPSSPAPSSGY